MTDAEKKFEKVGLQIPRILLPNNDIDLSKWSVVACDQYTSEPEYWKGIADYVSGSPSALHLILPETYLEEPGIDSRIEKINQSMQLYLDSGILQEHEPCFFLVQRETPDSPPRWGLMAALDLERYDYSRQSTSLIRATEGTILDRIPPRKRIRQNAPIELPHIIVLIDDQEGTVIEPFAARASEFEKVYDFDLISNGGHLRGYKISDQPSLNRIADALTDLASPSRFKQRYDDTNVMLFAMGDGNHSLATAKAIWEEYKADHSTDPELMKHPSRWALVEIENIYDKGLIFEPIHRVIFNSSFGTFETYLQKLGRAAFSPLSGIEEVLNKVSSTPDRHIIGYVDADRIGIFTVDEPRSTICAGTVQSVIDSLLADSTDTSVDYIHGADVTEKLGRKKNNIGIFLPPLDKNDFFRTVIKDGSLPRKTFSMGRSNEKRYYLEARKIL